MSKTDRLPSEGFRSRRRLYYGGVALDVFIKSVWEHQQPLFGLLPYTVQPSWIAQHSTIGVRRKLRKDVALRSARLVEKVRGFTRRALFNRSTTSRV